VIAQKIFVRLFCAARAIASHPIPAQASKALKLYQKEAIIYPIPLIHITTTKT